MILDCCQNGDCMLQFSRASEEKAYIEVSEVNR